MQSLKLIQNHGHLFVALAADQFLLDTGAPNSFGKVSSVELEGTRFSLPQSYMGLTAAVLSTYLGFETAGILGGDILNEFDLLIDVPQGQVSFSKAPLECAGEELNLEDFMGIPILKATIGSESSRMFFDTGAQISYFQGESLTSFPGEGAVTDFFPGMGPFSTDTFRVPIQLGSTRHDLRCGQLPGLLAMTLMMANTEGIIGNEVLRDRIVGYFPRRQRLIFS